MLFFCVWLTGNFVVCMFRRSMMALISSICLFNCCSSNYKPEETHSFTLKWTRNKSTFKLFVWIRNYSHLEFVYPELYILLVAIKLPCFASCLTDWPQRWVCSAVWGPQWRGRPYNPSHRFGTEWDRTLWPGCGGSSGLAQNNAAH